MRWRDRPACRSLCVVAGVFLAGCSQGGDSGDATTATTVAAASTPPASVTDAHDPPEPTEPPADDSLVGPTAPAATSETAGEMSVSGGPLPPALVDGYATNGGDLVDPDEWHSRFGDSDLPQVVGDDVKLVEALRRVEFRDGSWIRTDEANWLAMSSGERDDVLSELADATRATGDPQGTESVEQGADCVAHIYPPDAAGVQWQVQGCSYNEFPRLLALGVTRTGETDTQPSSIDPTVTALTDALDARVTFTEVRFGAPGADGSTLHLSAQLSSDADTATASAAATEGALADWQTFPGDDSMLLSGPSGATWTLGDGVAVFDWAGRW